MKKILGLFLVIVLGFGLVACGDKKPNPVPPGPGPGDEEEEKSDIDLNGQDFVIMVDKKDSEDPRLGTYAGLFKKEKAAAITKVQKKYNVNIVYENYPSNASWGGARERWIVENSTPGSSPAHILQVSSTSVGALAVNDAIVPLDDLIETYGPKGYWDEKKVFGQVFGETYLFDDVYSYSDDGLYYNRELLEEVLGKSRALEPTQLYLKGEWTWEAFERIADELNETLDHTRSDAEGGAQYVLGGRTYNWAYPMIGANGGVIVDSNFESHLTTEPVLETLDFISKLRRKEGMWIDNAPLENASQPEFTAGNVAFHQGMSWHLAASNKWANREFEIEFVPYPAGPNVTSGKGEYAVTHVYGKPSFGISSSYSKASIPPGYEDKMIHEETIFRIWNDLMYFPEVDSETNQISTQPFEDELYATRLEVSYGSQESIDAHLKVFSLAKPDFFYSLIESQGHVPGSYMLEIQDAIQNNTVRSKLVAINSAMDALLEERYRNK